ncbi:MAG: Inosine-5'-monophosphate dehydrogenase [Anaerolineales bacterium]|nr:Inosine-5'-monophosphate dehydrogenase [Anaerolineales bacterium]
MLVGERMSRPPIIVPPEMSILDALALFKKEHIRRAPVIKGGKLAGIVSEKDLLNASPSPATTLSVWEMNYLLSKLTVEKVMTKDVITVTEDTPIEEAARIMADNKIGGLPVVKGARVVGIITETNLFKMFLELMGAREHGVRVTALVEDKPGMLAQLTRAISEAGGNFLAFGQFVGEDVNTRVVTFKVNGLGRDKVKKTILDIVAKIWDIREM